MNRKGGRRKTIKTKNYKKMRQQVMMFIFNVCPFRKWAIMGLHAFLFFIIGELSRHRRKDSEVDSRCLHHGQELKVFHRLNWPPSKAGELNLRRYLNHGERRDGSLHFPRTIVKKRNTEDWARKLNSAHRFQFPRRYQLDYPHIPVNSDSGN